MQRDKQESIEHEYLVHMMAYYFFNQGFQNIKADIPGMPSPDVIHGTKRDHIPDLTADKNGVKIILEAETASSILNDHTVSQWSLFSDAAKKAGGEFHVVVPKRSRSTAEQRAIELNIINTIWTPN